MPLDTAILTLDNPVFQTYVLAACIMTLKLLLQPWMTVYRMLKTGGGFRSPEDLKKSPINPEPDPSQLEVNEYVDRSRRINLNDLESIPAFLAIGLLFVLSGPSLLLTQILVWTYVISRGVHFLAYATAQLHDVRATLWTVGSLALVTMTIMTMINAL